MDNSSRIKPIFTIETECHDCYKCIRLCPVKAIRVEGGYSKIVPELCISCGNCVKVCPAKAKRVRNDLDLARDLVKKNSHPTIAALAPSWIAEFNEYTQIEMINILRNLGFSGVSEIAVGAREISEWIAEKLNYLPEGFYFSSACTAVVDFINKYHPKYQGNILNIASPVICHSKILRQKLGPDISVIMIGPCVAKKNEADRYQKDLDLVITYQDVRHWIEENNVNIHEVDIDKNQKYILEENGNARLYPLEGGMFESIKHRIDKKRVRGITISGIDQLEETIKDIASKEAKEVVFIEALSCKGGCINGPCTTKTSSILSKTVKVQDSVNGDLAINKCLPYEPIYIYHQEEYYNETKYSPQQISEALESVGKKTVNDELNCDGCGYSTCRNFAIALLENKAESQMCVSYMRNLAQKKANALLRSIPAGVVMMDVNMKIIESNRYLAELFGKETILAYDAKPGLSGALIERIIPFHSLFKQALDEQKDAFYKAYKYKDSYYDIIIFTIDRNVIGGMIFDVTGADLKRGQIVEKANAVINKNVFVVQRIASLLGEQMAETEVMLREIADVYGKKESSYKEL